MRRALVILTAAAVLPLAACGGATVDSGSSQGTSVAPLSRAPRTTESTSESSSASASESASSTATSAGASGRATQAPKDKAVQEISALPSEGPARTQKEKDYLKQLQDQGIKVDGIEDQMIGAATEVCRQPDATNNYTLGAIAGQLAEQKLTDMPVDKAADVIAKAAKDAYC